MTEDEARTKWCPFFRRAGDGGNADADGGRRTTCIASACMMWVTTEGRNKQGTCGLAKGG